MRELLFNLFLLVLVLGSALGIGLCSQMVYAQEEHCAGAYDTDVLVKHGGSATWCWTPATGNPEGYYVYRPGGTTPIATVEDHRYTHTCGLNYEKVQIEVVAFRGLEEGPRAKLSFAAHCAVDTDFDDSGGQPNATDFTKFFVPSFMWPLGGMPQL